MSHWMNSVIAALTHATTLFCVTALTFATTVFCVNTTLATTLLHVNTQRVHLQSRNLNHLQDE